MVIVTATAAKVNSSTVGLGIVVEQTEVNDLALNGRSLTELLMLVPRSSMLDVDQNLGNSIGNFFGHRIGSVGFPAANGQSNRNNMFLVDGLNSQGVMGSNYTVSPILGDTQELKVQSDSTEAKFSSGAGAVVNVVTNTGTNHFHGTAWEFLQNNAWDARSPFFASVIPVHLNQFGADLGGLVPLPYYNGWNRTFLFASYEGVRQSQASHSLYSVPTPMEINGKLSSLGAAIYNPFTIQPDPNNPGPMICDELAAGIIPPKLIDPGMVKFAKPFFSQPVTTGVPGFNGIENQSTIVKQDEFSDRVDEQLNDKNSFWFRYTPYHQPITGPRWYVGLQEQALDKDQNWGASYLHTFGPSAVLQFDFGRTVDIAYSGTAFSSTPAGILNSIDFNLDFTCGYFHGYCRNNCLVPGVGISGSLGGGDSYNEDGQTDLYQYSVDLTKVHASHTFDIGYSFYTTGFDGVKAYNSFSFNSPKAVNPEDPGNTGSPLASFLLGVSDSDNFRSAIESERGVKHTGVYFQDQ